MTTRVLLLSLCVALTHATASAQQKPDLSGDWVLSAEKSDFGPIPPPQCVGLKIAHKGSEFAIEETDERGANCALKLTYTIDGPAITYTTPAGVRNRARAAWVDAALVTQRVGDDGISVRVESSLSPDGKTLVRMLHGEAAQGSADWTYVYDRVVRKE
jgi:hypothetical protein